MKHDYKIEKINSKIAKEYIRNNHYSKGSHNGPSPCYGLFYLNELIGVLMFATPCSENVRKSIFGEEMKHTVIELHRLHIKDITPKNTESWFISRCLKLLKEEKNHIKCVISFSDRTEGHKGIIYRATNALFYGMSVKSNFYLDKDNRLRHPRQNGINITSDMAENLGWKKVKRDSKYRYLWLLGNKREVKQSKRMLKVKLYNYPNDN